MESGYNHQYLYDLLKSKGYNVKVAHPFMVKAIAYAKVKTDKVDARILADLLRTDMIPRVLVVFSADTAQESKAGRPRYGEKRRHQ